MKGFTLHIKIDVTKENSEIRTDRARTEMETGVVKHRVYRNKTKYTRKPKYGAY